jgi:hypothetical protein
VILTLHESCVYKKIILLILVTLSSLIAGAQFSDSIHHYISYGATGIINKTNDGSSYVLTNALKYNLNKKSIRLNSNTSYIYGEQLRRLSNNDFTSTLDFNLYKTFPHFYYWGLASYDKSYSLKIIDRLQAGLGAAYNILDKPTAAINISNGILYESSSLQLNDSTQKSFQIFRNSFRLRYRFVIKEVVVFDGLHFFQNSLSDSHDYIIKSVSNCTFKIRKWLGLTTSATYNRNQRTNRENLLITFGLTADKYF